MTKKKTFFEKNSQYHYGILIALLLITASCATFIELHKIRQEEKVAAFEDWNRRLMEFMDMPEEERGEAVKRYITDKKFEEVLSEWITPYSQIFSLFH